MAEVFVTKLTEAVVSQVVKRIVELLIREANSLRSVRTDIRDVQKELRLMKSFLKDAERKQDQDERVRIWITEVRDVACVIEDSIETYIFKVHTSSIEWPFYLRNLRTTLNMIKDQLKSIDEQKQRYQIQYSSGDEATSSLGNLRRSYPDDEEDDVITLKDTMAALKDQLMAEENQGVVSIVGMAGLGKTTLAKKVYNDDDTKKHFDCRAWVFISQQCVTREVLSEILIQVSFQPGKPERREFGKQKYTKEFLEERKSTREFLNGLQEHELASLMKTVLEEKRYLIVLDDIWSIDARNSVQSAFPKGKSGSKVMVTTRIETVALSADSHLPPIKPPLLTPTESWELLKRKMLPQETFGELGFPLEFEEQGKKIMEKCGGLPLAIVVLGGFLRMKWNNSVDEWVNVLKDVNINKLKLTQQYRVEDILELSFQDLPCHLKPCFLYLASFPEDGEIPNGRLVRLWIAEGFIPTVGKDAGGTLMEDVGEQYLRELVDRCMVQVSKKDRTGKGVKSCRMHVLMRDFCISKAREELFLEVVQPSEVNLFATTTTRSRRIAVHVNDDLHWVEQVHSNLRSVLCSAPILSLTKENFWLLRVLELGFLQKVDRCKLPEGTGNLIHLRYLKVCGAEELIMPNSIGKLQNLQTLDLRVSWRVILPRSMPRLGCLRHLFLPYRYSRPRWAMGVILENDSLKRIVTLKGIRARDLIRGNEVLALSNIRVLEIKDFISDKEVALVLNSLSFHSQLGNLKSLGMEFWGRGGEFSNLELLSHCHVLSRLSLAGGLSRENITYLPKSLVKLRLSFFSLNQEKIAVMEKLPNLRILEFSYVVYHTEYHQLVFSVGGFPKLEFLELSFLYRFVEWEVEEGAMPNLKRLDLSGLLELRMIPEGLKHVTTLRELNISRMPKKFEDRLRVNEDGIEGEDFYKVRQIPFITFSYTQNYASYKLGEPALLDRLTRLERSTSNVELYEDDQYSQFTDDVEF